MYKRAITHRRIGLNVLLSLFMMGCRTVKLHEALYPEADAEMVVRYIRSGVNIDARDSRGRTALYIAALRGDENLVSLLLREGADPTRGASSRGGETPLHVAASHGHEGAIKLLLEAGVDPNIRSSFDSTPLHHAAWMKHAAATSLLLQEGANPALRDADGRTPLNGIGAFGDGPEYCIVVETLLDQGVPVNAQERNGFTPLIDACYAGSTSVVELLIRRGADVNLASSSKLTPLIIASARGNIDVIPLLLRAGADLHSVTKGGRTAKSAAEDEGYLEIVKLLEDAKANGL